MRFPAEGGTAAHEISGREAELLPREISGRGRNRCSVRPAAGDIRIAAIWKFPIRGKAREMDTALKRLPQP